MSTTASMEMDNSWINLNARGSFTVEFTENSEIQRMLNVKDGEKFKVTVERVKK